jgi:hypothetical protein
MMSSTVYRICGFICTIPLYTYNPLPEEEPSGSKHVEDIKLQYIPHLKLPPHVHIDFVVPPPGCGRSVTDF